MTSSNQCVIFAVCLACAVLGALGQSTATATGNTTTVSGCGNGTIDVLGTCTQCHKVYTGCAKGSYQPTTGHCTACSAEQVSYFINSVRCFTCSANGDGSQPNLRQSECECPVGSYFKKWDGGNNCTTCAAGLVTTKPNSAQCSHCPGNAVANAAQSACDCPAGSYWTNTSTGVLNCTACAFNQVSTANAGACVTCDTALRHLQPNANRSGCECLRNQVRAADGLSCYCPKGSYINSGNCTKCPSGSVSLNIHANACQQCPLGAPNANQDGCTCSDPNAIVQQLPSGWRCVCKANYYQPTAAGSLCTACPGGSFTNGYARDTDDTAACKTCSAKETLTKDPTDGYQQCKCTLPFVASTAGQPCMCPAGYYLATNTTCTKCAAGYYSSNPDATSCASCSGLGQVVNDAQTTCSCKTNFVAVNTTACACPAGFYLSNGVCTQCATGWVSTAKNSQTCTRCPTGERSNSANIACVSATLSATCPAGSYLNDANKCSKCLSGSVSYSANATTCIACANKAGGTKPNTEQTECYCETPGTMADAGGACLCHAGMIRTNETGQEACTACPEGTTSDSNSTYANYCIAREPCSKGTYLYANTTDRTRTCQTCPPNTVSNGGNATACTPCGVGLKPNAVMSACICADSTKVLSNNACVCKPGTYINADGSCTTCPPDMVSYQPAVTVCSRCPDALVPAADQASCVCPANMRLMCGTGECYCPIGWFRDASDGFLCKQCPTDKTTTQINAFSCTDAAMVTNATTLPSGTHTSTSKFTLTFPIDYTVLSQHPIQFDSFKDRLAEIISTATNVSIAQIAVATVRSGSVIADVYVSTATASVETVGAVMVGPLPTLFDQAFRDTFQLEAGIGVTAAYVKTESNTPEADAKAFMAAASRVIAKKAFIIVGVELAILAVIAGVIAVIIIKRRKAASLAETVAVDREMLLQSQVKSEPELLCQ